MMSNDMIQKATAQPAAKSDAKTSMQAYIKQMQGEIKKALPAVMTPERFTRIVLSALSTNPKLGQTTPAVFSCRYDDSGPAWHGAKHAFGTGVSDPIL